MKRYLKNLEEPKFSEERDPEPQTDLFVRVIDAAIVICVLLACLWVWQHADSGEMESAAGLHKEVAQRYAGMLADCMNGKALIDAKAKKAYFCGKVIEVDLT